MRSFNQRYEISSNAPVVEPFFTIEMHFDGTGTDVVYFTSHEQAGYPTGAEVIPACLDSLTGATQKIDPRSSASSIGSVNFELIDRDGLVSQLLAQKNSEGKSPRNQKVVVYYGYDDRLFSALDEDGNPIEGFYHRLDWLDYERHFTMLLSDYSESPGRYSFQLNDVQRLENKELFVLDKSTLRQSISADDLFIPVAENSLTNKFQTIAHDQSYTDRPNESVGYIRIRDEVISHSGVVISAEFGVSLAVVERGALNTIATAHSVDESVSDDRKTKVEEFVYLEGPALKLLYALQTGVLYGQGGETLPEHWHQNIPTDLVRLSDYLNADVLLWEPSVNTGRVLRFEGLAQQNGESFIRQQLLSWLSGIRPVYSSGEIGFKKLSSVLSDSDFVFELTHDNVVRFGDLQHRLRDVVNQIAINWDWSFLKRQYVQTTSVVDLNSINKYGYGEPKIFSFLGVKSSNQTDQDMRNVFDGYRNRYGGGGFTLTAELMPSVSQLEVGDLVRVRTTVLVDPLTNGPLDRVFEVQQIAPNTRTGRPRVSLFASTDKAGDFEVISQGAVLEDAFYTSEGTDIASVATMVGNIITEDVTLVGGETVGDGVFYYDGDLILDSSATIYIENNVQLRVRGQFTRNGDIIGVGRGHSGGAGATVFIATGSDSVQIDLDDNSLLSYAHDSRIATNEGLGVQGYIGVSRPGNFGLGRGNKSTVNGEVVWRSTIALPEVAFRVFDSARTIVGINASAVRLPLINRDGLSLQGLDQIDLRGTSGPGGRPLIQAFEPFVRSTDVDGLFEIVQPGAAGGASGAGLVVICRGETVGAGSTIDLSGQDGEVPSIFQRYDRDLSQFFDFCINGGGGGGAPGAYYLLIDGNASFGSGLTNVAQRRGLAGEGGTEVPPRVAYEDATVYGEVFEVNRNLGYVASLGRSLDLPLSFGEAGFQVQFIPPRESLGNGPDGADSQIERYQLPPVENLTLETGTAHLLVAGDGTIRERIRVSFDPVDDPNVTHYVVGAAEVGSESSEWRTVAIADADSPLAYIDVTEGVEYTVGVYADGNRSLVDRSLYQYATITASGKSEAPAVPVIVSAYVDLRTGLTLELEPHPDPDFYEFVAALDGVEQARDSGTRIGFGLPTLALHTISVFAIDRTGNQSPAVSSPVSVLPPDQVSVQAQIVGGQVVLSWPSAARSLAIERYEIRHEGSLVATLSGFDFAIQVSWLGSRVFTVTATDLAGNQGLAGEVAVVVNPPASPVISHEFVGPDVLLSWPDSATTLPISQYVVSRSGAAYSRQNANSILIPVDWGGQRTFGVTAIDTAGNVTQESVVSVTPQLPSAPVVNYAIEQNAVTFTATSTQASLPLARLIIRHQSEVIAEVSSDTWMIPVTWLGSRTFQFQVVDTAGNASGLSSVTVSPSGPAAPQISLSFSSGSALLSWNDPAGDLSISRYLIRQAGSTIADVTQPNWQTVVDWSGSRTFEVIAVDLAGNQSSAGSVIVNPAPPSAPVFTSEVIDNNVLFKYASSSGSLPIEGYDLRKGPVFASAQDFASKAGTSSFTTLFENAAGTYTYWVSARDTAGNVSQPTSNTATVSQPPDFVLFARYSLRERGWLGTLTNARVGAIGTLLAPINTAETWQQYLSNGYSTLQDEINAGFTAWVTPSPSTARYEEVIDYGVLLEGSLITASLTPDAIAGSVATSVRLSYSTNGSTWVDGEVGQLQVFGTQFRFIRIAVDFTADGNDLLEIEDIQITLDRKLRSDAGRGTASASDSGGTSVSFNADFVDVVSINVTPRGTSSVQAVYDFVDQPNPTEMFVYLFDSAGNRVSGDFSWSVEGY